MRSYKYIDEEDVDDEPKPDAWVSSTVPATPRAVGTPLPGMSSARSGLVEESKFSSLKDTTPAVAKLEFPLFSPSVKANSKTTIALIEHELEMKVAVDTLQILDTDSEEIKVEKALRMEELRLLECEHVCSAHDAVEKWGASPKGYVLRVLVPCYKEDLEIVRSTCIAALHISYKHVENIFVYLCDDGNDPAKRNWVAKMQQNDFPNLFYITRPKKFKGHGKAGNLNYTLRDVIYRKKDEAIRSRELVAIFDADMVCMETFFENCLTYFKEDKSVVMVQTPQTFYNVPKEADFFDAHNIQFFQFMLPAYSSWNLVSCCGTNFIVQAKALQGCGWFPTISVTEDMYLSICMLAKKGKLIYHAENLVVGEAPQDLRQIFQQRSRWAKGTMQIFFKDNPLFKSGLNWLQKISFFNSAWSYLTSAFMNPLFVIINAAGILFGLFPVTNLGFFAAMLFVMYYVVFYSVIHYSPAASKHFISLWVVGKMGHFFSFMAFKAIFNVLKGFLVKKSLVFKVTEKKKLADGRNVEMTEEAEEQRDSSRKDIVYHWIMSIFIFSTIVYGVASISLGKDWLPLVNDERSAYQKKGIRLFMCFWMIQFWISYSLPIWYAYLPNNFATQARALKYLAFVDSFISGMLVVLTVLLFKIGFLVGLPQIDDITELPLNPNPLWLTGYDSHADLGSYIYDSALNNTIPVLVVYERPSKELVLTDEGGISSWTAYKALLSDMADQINEKRFPCLVIFEPFWMEELMYLSDDIGEKYYYDVFDDTNYLIWDYGNWFQLISSLNTMLDSFPSKSRVYLDVGSADYLQALNSVPLSYLNQSNLNYDSLTGFVYNTKRFQLSSEIIEYASTVYQTYGTRYMIDSSRNGGLFSERSYEERETCRYDPPRIEAGFDPSWENTTTSNSLWGLDGYFWSEEIGYSDGRLYTKGDYHSCLLNHPIECSDDCPEIPAFKNGAYVRDSTCDCD